ncbi:flagellar export chaperone FliS [Bacillus sp. REN10]|uniref:flagellar export chaperone FliS n=1 Tax=Bacillus sp. REN10 TaxID=2782541 RepID=UPI00193C6398|nr:flagellar export chaperone FliS [Bacillus sp. REN10]
MKEQQKAHQQYKQMSEQTAAPEEQMISLLQEAIKEVKKGKAAIHKEDRAKRNESLAQGQAYVLSLIPFINHKTEEGERLISVYGYINRLLIRANIESNQELLQEAEELLLRLQMDWAEALKFRRKQYVGDLI